MNNTHLSIILPIYNEEKRIGMCLAHVLDYLWLYTHVKFEVICVLNGCTDGSESICRQFFNRWAQIKIINLPVAGKGAAVKAGMLAAVGEYRYMADVDLSTPIDLVTRFLNAAIQDNDIVCGIRQIKHRSIVRLAAHKIYSKMAGTLTNLRDTQCGFKMFRGACADNLFSRVTVPGWGFDAEVMYLARLLNYRVIEIPIPWEHSVSGSKLNPARDGMQMALTLRKIRKLHTT